MSQNESGLINHDNFDKSVVRGSSQALILFFFLKLKRTMQDLLITDTMTYS